MNKIYSGILALMAFGAVATAQTDIYYSNFDDADGYGVAGVQADVATHADWRQGSGGQKYMANGDPNTEITIGGNWNSLINNTPITGDAGDFLTITSLIQLGYDNQTWPAADKAMGMIGLTDDVTNGGPDLGNTSKREGLIFNYNATAKTLTANSAGDTSFGTSPVIPAGTASVDKTAFEFTYTIQLGNDAASTIVTAKIQTYGSANNTSLTETFTGISSSVYTAITSGAGAHAYFWSYQFYEANPGISLLIFNNLRITTDAAASVSEINATDISSSIYPNPATDVLNINVESASYQVTNIYGATVLEGSNNGSVDVSGLATGVYYILTDAGSAKFIKK